jgi:hypothetical protein
LLWRIPRADAVFLGVKNLFNLLGVTVGGFLIFCVLDILPVRFCALAGEEGMTTLFCSTGFPALSRTGDELGGSIFTSAIFNQGYDVE